MAMIAAAREYIRDVWEAWDEFWFTPTNPATYSAIRVLAGAMLLYTHLVWTYDLEAFFGQDGWLPPSLMQEMDRPPGSDAPARWNWSYFNHIDSPALLWTVHIGALVVFFLLTIGLFSRTMAVLAFIATISYSNRITPGAFFGLDTINSMLAMYLIVGPCGARYSLDRLWRMRRGRPAEPPPSVAANVGIRLIQLHMCIVYLFSGIGKIRGEDWWNGSAAWISLANTEYQTLDMTWIGDHLYLINFLTVSTVFWELSYCALIWPRLTRPWMLLMAVLVHGGIIFALGMPTFGLVMLIGNLAFVPPRLVQKVFDPVARRISLAVVGAEGQGGGGSPRSSGASQSPPLTIPR
jgi:uncharacterized membrane protein YphA (DoxX/SURF4 family)